MGLLRAAVDPADPLSYDLLIYVLQAVGRFAEAVAVSQQRAAAERHRGLAALRQQLVTAVQAVRDPAPAARREVPVDQALPLLEQAVRGNRIVILAEEHASPEHRAFGARVLPALAAAGVTHLALETGNQAALDDALRTGHVLPSTDGFAFEPQRAALLRTALGLGLPLVAFDVDADDMAQMQAAPNESVAFRERRMAEHLVERVLQPEPMARVLIWVGYGHAQKWSPPGFPRMMVQHLEHLADDAPFSAYQVSGPGRRTAVDLLIRHPAPEHRRHVRPEWLHTPDRRVVRGEVTPHHEYLVQLQLATEGTAGTPVDQLLTEADGQFQLLVPSGAYRLRVRSPEGRVVREQPLTVTGDVPGLRLEA